MTAAHTDPTIPSRKATRQAAQDWRRSLGLREMGVYYALILLVLTIALASAWLGKPNYLSTQNLTNVLYQASLLAMMAAAMTVVLITGNFDLSVASVAALSGALFIGFVERLGVPGAFVLAVLAAAGLGLVNGAIIMGLGINSFIVTLGTLTTIRGFVLIYTDGRSIEVTNVDTVLILKAMEGARVEVGLALLVLALLLALWCGWRIRRAERVKADTVGGLALAALLAALSLANGLSFTVRAPVVYATLFIAATWFVMSFTTFGRKLHAVGGNPEAARLSGINVTSHKLFALIMCSATGGFAGVLFAARIRSMAPASLTGMELTVIAAAILGGTSLFGGAGSVMKTVAGALLLVSLGNGFNILNMGPNYQGVIEGIVVIAAAAIYSVGSRKG